MKRPGFTLMELLIAAALGTTVLALGLQQLMEYFRLQQVLMTRTQLRQDAKLSLERIAEHMRYCPKFGQSAKGPIGIKPLDLDKDGVMTHKDHYELVLWQVLEDPLKGDRRIIQENSTIVPAFLPTDQYDELLPFFEGRMGKGRRLASFVQRLEIVEKGLARAQVRLEVTQQVPRQKEPVTLRLTEMVAVRSHLIVDAAALPTHQQVLEKLKASRP